MTETEQPAGGEERPQVAADEPPADTANTPPRRRRWVWGVAIVVVAVAAAGAGAALTWPRWQRLVLPPPPFAAGPPVPQPMAAAPVFRPAGEVPGMSGADLQALRDDLAGLRARVSALEAQAPASGGAWAAGSNVDARLGRAETAIDALKARPELPASLADDLAGLARQVDELKRTSADAAAVLRLADRVGQAEMQLRDMQSRRAGAVALLLAVGQLREAVDRAMPFDAELRALQALGSDDAEIIRLTQVVKGRAVAGVPQLAVLAARFGRLAPDLVRAEVLPDEQNWWRRTLERLANLVVIRREDGDAAGHGPAAIVARIDGRLAEGDLMAAAAEAAGFTGAAAELAAPWVADLKARVVADKVVSELTAHVIAQVGAKQ